MLVTKRDGGKQPFDISRIQNAILKAAQKSGRHINDLPQILAKAEKKFCDKKSISIDDIQNYVEHLLQCSSHKEIAKEYIMYRHDRDVARESGGALLASVQSFLDQSDVEVAHENANKDSKAVSTHRDLLAGILSKHFATRHLLPKDVSEAHNQGFIHVHDLDYLLSPLTNCQLVNYRDMLEGGFKVGDAEISRPKSIGVASTVLTQIIQAVASSQYGGQTIADIDSGLAPYVEESHKKLLAEQKLYGLPDQWVTARLLKEVRDSMQAFLYQVNTLTTTNGQTPFITISFGQDTSYYGRLITQCYLEAHREGLGVNKVTPVFPKVIFLLEDGVNLKQGDPNYDLKQQSLVCSTERIYPDYISVPLNKAVTGASQAVSSMGCRSFLSRYEDASGKEKYDGRFNIGVVSLNLPMIAQESLGKDFYKALDHYFDLAVKAHMVRVNRLKGTKARQNPTLFMYGAIARLGADETIDNLLYNGYASISIGFIGLAEACTILTGKEQYSKEDALEICEYLSAKCKVLKEQTKLGFSLYGTPSEGYALRAAKCFKKRFGPEIISRDYLTNSFHQPVWVEGSPVAKWEFEAEFSKYCSGGHIGYIEQPSLKDNLPAYESFVDLAYRTLPYFGINTPVDSCHKCGFSGEFSASPSGYVCPSCGNSEEGTISVVRRISGYLTAPNSRPVNAGKQQEICQRVKHV